MKKWINCTKWIAITAVLIDHTYSYLYTDFRIYWLLYFSVSLFIILSGITAFYSFSKKDTINLKIEYKKKFFKVVMPYVIATLIYVIYRDHMFNLFAYVDALLNFNAAPPLYFVLFFLELTIISPFLFRLIQYINGSKSKTLLSLFFIFVFAILCINFSYVSNIGAASTYLFGGTNLFLYFVGMLFASYESRIIEKFKKIKCIVPTFFITSICLVFIVGYISKNGYAREFINLFKLGINPPGSIIMIYTACIFLFLFIIFHKVEQIAKPIIIKLIDFISYMGCHTYFIFLYHYLFLILLKTNDNIIVKFLPNIWMKRIFCILVITFMPILIEYMYTYIEKKIKTINKINCTVNES